MEEGGVTSALCLFTCAAPDARRMISVGGINQKFRMSTSKSADCNKAIESNFISSETSFHSL
jgi:hypothetical protein